MLFMKIASEIHGMYFFKTYITIIYHTNQNHSSRFVYVSHGSCYGNDLECFVWKKQLTFSLLANSLLNGWTFQQVGLILRLIGFGPPDCPGHDFSGDSGFLKNHSSSQKNMVVFIAIIKWGPGPTLATLASKVRFEWLLWSSYSQTKIGQKLALRLVCWISSFLVAVRRRFGIFRTTIVCSWSLLWFSSRGWW